MMSFVKSLAVVALATAALCSPTPIYNGTDINIAARQLAGQRFFGDATFFEPGLGACGITNGPNDFIAAASHQMFDTFPGATVNPNTNPICGKSVTAIANGHIVTVLITDRCANCNGLGDLDFSPAAFQQLGPLSFSPIHVMTYVFND